METDLMFCIVIGLCLVAACFSDRKPTYLPKKVREPKRVPWRPGNDNEPWG